MNYQSHQPKDTFPQTKDCFLSCASDTATNFFNFRNDSASHVVVVKVMSPILIDKMQIEKTIDLASLSKSTLPPLPQTSTKTISTSEL